MSDFDRTLIETTRTHRERLAAAFVYGPLKARRKVPKHCITPWAGSDPKLYLF